MRWLMFMTDAPAIWLRQIAGLGVRVEWQESNAHPTLDMLIRIHPDDADGLVRGMLAANFRVHAWAKPKPILVDPTWAMAAARLEGEAPNGGAAPAPAWAR